MEQYPCATMNYPTSPEVVKAKLAELNAVGWRAYETFLRCHLALLLRWRAHRLVLRATHGGITSDGI
jgi:hypothetical protein